MDNLRSLIDFFVISPIYEILGFLGLSFLAITLTIAVLFNKKNKNKKKKNLLAFAIVFIAVLIELFAIELVMPIFEAIKSLILFGEIKVEAGTWITQYPRLFSTNLLYLIVGICLLAAIKIAFKKENKIFLKYFVPLALIVFSLTFIFLGIKGFMGMYKSSYITQSSLLLEKYVSANRSSAAKYHLVLDNAGAKEYVSVDWFTYVVVEPGEKLEITRNEMSRQISKVRVKPIQ